MLLFENLWKDNEDNYKYDCRFSCGDILTIRVKGKVSGLSARE